MSHFEIVHLFFMGTLEGAAPHSYLQFRHSGVAALFKGVSSLDFTDHLRVVFFLLFFNRLENLFGSQRRSESLR